MPDSPLLARLRAGHFNTDDWNPASNPGGMGGDGHRRALIPPRGPQAPAYPVLVNDLVALADELAAYAFPGGAVTATLSADYALPGMGPRLFNLTPDAPGRSVILPDATTYGAAGAGVAHILNRSAQHALCIRAAGGQAGLAMLAPGQGAVLHLLDRSGAAGVWHIAGQAAAGGLCWTAPQTLSAATAWNHRLSSLNRADKALWSYNDSAAGQRRLCVRVLTIAGRTVTAGPEQVLHSGPAATTDIGGVGLALSGTGGVALWWSGAAAMHSAFAINADTGVCTLTGTAVDWALGASPDGAHPTVRMARVPGAAAAVAVMRAPSGRLHARLLVLASGLISASAVTDTGLSTGTGGAALDVAVADMAGGRLLAPDGANGGLLTAVPLSLTLTPGAPALSVGALEPATDGVEGWSGVTLRARGPGLYTVLKTHRDWRGVFAGGHCLALPGTDQTGGRPGGLVFATADSGLVLHGDFDPASGSQRLCAARLTYGADGVLRAGTPQVLTGLPTLQPPTDRPVCDLLPLTPTLILAILNSPTLPNLPQSLLLDLPP